VDANKILIQYAGTSADIMRGFLEEYPALLPMAQVRGQVSRQEAMTMLFQSDLLLLASWNTQKEQGIMTGKVYEYMMMQKPIVTTITGDRAMSELREVLHSIGQDCVWEEADKNSHGILKAGIWAHYQAFEHLGYVPRLQNTAQCAAYSYEKLAGTLLSITQ